MGDYAGYVNLAVSVVNLMLHGIYALETNTIKCTCWGGKCCTFEDEVVMNHEKTEERIVDVPDLKKK
jgi:hypothetical protein